MATNVNIQTQILDFHKTIFQSNNFQKNMILILVIPGFKNNDKLSKTEDEFCEYELNITKLGRTNRA